MIQLTEGYIVRHAPATGAQGREAALIDVAQDILLRHLSDTGVLELFAFKGGTALRKVYAGAVGRFSTDLDFSVANRADDPAAALDLLVGQIDGVELGPFTFTVSWRNGKPTILYASTFGDAGSVLQSQARCGTAAVADANAARLGSRPDPQPLRGATTSPPGHGPGREHR